jgi:preprotein translocase subunit SecD
VSLRLKFWLIIALTLVCAVLAFPREDQIFKAIGLKKAKLQVKQGLDLQGGAYLVFQADLSKTPKEDHDKAVSSLIEVIQRRANPSGTAEVSVQRQGSDKVVVQLPGVKDVNDAVDRIGKTANLTFLEVTGTGTNAQTSDPGIGGKDVDSATADFDPQTSQPVVRLQMKGAAVQKFADLTTRINKTNGQLVTLLDDQIVFGPATVSSPITDGNAQLSGNFKSVAEAKKIADQITAGALPVPVSLVEERTVGPTLGQESITKSLIAGIIGLAVVAIFMIAYYRLAGVLAILALMVYTVLTLSLYKLSGISPYPIVLTLAGTAGFILSIGMAVDANILVFERLKEELRSGKSYVAALEAGFDRAWTSIRDSNVSTLITCFILYFFGAPIIKGFAVTLGMGVLISLFTSIVVSRTLMRLMIQRSWGRTPGAYGLRKDEVPE